jgi:large subunit ribosomal protein L5
MERLKEKYQKEVVPAMAKEDNLKSPMAVPAIEKVVVSTGFGKMIASLGSDEQKKTVNAISRDLSLITGQYPVVNKAKKAISSFKLRKGMPAGASVVLRGEKMYDFLERVINIALPRSRDFSGIPLKSFDKEGNLTIPVKEQNIFPEISPEDSKINFGLEITVVTTAKTKEEGVRLLRLLGFPLKKENS